MLNQDTKRRIDSARDILVGKVPDPKAQVEQITTALIYKFMDDMDNESEELGGKARFFVGDYEKYAWSKLLNTRLGGIERLNLYTEALIKLPQNPTLPQLFRDILKDAFLPYRDPETLNLFLKEINSFTYDHSEKLGDAFEYLLSIMGAQGDAGQFRTPRHIIDFIVEVVNPKKEETILDPACGTAGFLISAYKHILRENGVRVPGDQLTPDQRTKLTNHFIGYDISPDMVRMSLVNMYLHSFPNPRIYEYDTLTSEERWNETYDVVMANPPFMSPKGGIRPHKRFSIQANRSEVLFVDYIAEHLTIHGRAGVIVPEGIIFQSGTAYKALRKMLVDKYLYAVVSLPGGIFQPYSGVKTSILLMDKNLAKKADSILFVKVENDGFDLGAQRRAIDKNDLLQALIILQGYKQALQENRDTSELLIDPQVAKMAVLEEKAAIAKSGEYYLSGERYRENLIKTHREWPMVALGDEKYFQIEAGGTPDSQNPIYWHGDVQWATLVDLPAENLITEITDTKRKITDLGLKDSSAKLLPKNSVLVSSRATIGRVAINKVELATNQGFKNIIIKDFTSINPKYVAYMMTTLVEQMVNLASGGTFKEISKTNFSTLRIPLPPLEAQQEIVAELNGYQKIIDGARQIVASYKPTVKLPPGCDMVDLGGICEQIQYGISEPMNTEGKGYKIFRMHEIKEGFLVDNGNMKFADISQAEFYKYRLNGGDILFNRTNSYEHVGRTGIFKLTGEYCFASYLIRLVINKALAIPDYINYFMNTDHFQITIKLKATRAIGQANINAKSLAEYRIPLPSLEMQEQIVAQIVEEQKLVNASKNLIGMFEQKIKDKIAEVWGEETTAPLQSDLVAVS